MPGSGTDVDGDTLTYSWSCASGSLSNPLIAQPTYMAPLVNTDTDYICTLTVNDGKGGQASDATKITVKNQTLAVSLTANPASGNAPLTGVDLTADISGTAIGAINYIFYCNRADSGTNVTSGWARQIEGTNVDPFTANDVCNYTVSGTYTAKVIVERGTAAAEDRIVINVSQPSNNLPLVSAGPDKEVFENQVVVLQGSASDPDGDSLTYSWNCTGGSLSNSQTPQPTYLAPAVTSDTDYTCTFTATDSRNGSASDNVLVKVKNQTLSVSLTANPASGTAPLFGVDLTADVSGTAPGTINYIFYCNRSDSGTNVTSGWAFRQDGTNTDPLTANDVCDYTSSGSYTAKVIAERGALSAEARATITVSGNTVPTVDLKANGFDGPITIPYNASANLSWQSNNATSCTASGAWSGNKPLSGSQSTGNLTSSKTYTITCSRDSLTIIDSVTINVESTDPNHPPVANAGPDKEVIEEQTVVLQGSGTDPDNDSLSYVWACNGGTLSDNHISQPVFTAPTVNADTTYVCNLTVNDNRGASNSDSMNVMVRNRNSSLTVSLSANPASGNAPLNDIDLTADVSGTAEGTINYIFYCNRADSGTNVTSGWAFRQDGTNTDPLTANDVCDYTSSGSYTAKVIAERGALSAEARATITVSGNTVPTVDLKANGFDGPITIPYNASANLSWQSNNATSCTASNAWSGAKAAAGSENTGSLTSSRIYTLICYGAGGSASDSVVVNVTGTGNNSPIANAGPDKTVYSGQTVILEGSGSDPDNDAITYSWYCNGGTLSASYVNQPVFTAPYVNSDTVYTCILTVNDNRGASNSDSMNVTVRSQGLSVGSFTANPSSGNAPLNGVDFTVDVIGASGPINYIFYCNRTDSGTNITSGWNYRLDSSNYDPLSVNDVCNYSTPGIYNAKVIVERSSMAAEARVTINVSGNVAPSVDIKANGFDGPITIPNNASANLSWQSTNAASCTATNGWTGTKATSGSENTGNLITSKTYTLTCSGTGGSASDSVVVNAEASKNLLATINVRNITDNTVLAKSVNADPTEKIEISIQVSGVNQTVPAVTVRASLPSRMNYEGNLKIDGAANSGNILSGISLGDLAAGQTKTITFEASVGNETQFNFGVNNLIATMIAYNTSTAITDSATIVVTRRAVAGAATGVSTGITDSLVNYLLIPGALATALVWLLRRNLLFVEEWWDKRKTAMFHLKTERDLQNKISRIRIQEHFQD